MIGQTNRQTEITTLYILDTMSFHKPPHPPQKCLIVGDMGTEQRGNTSTRKWIKNYFYGISEFFHILDPANKDLAES